jgi:T5SS/PEP-CTERM-associated repeat protein
VADLTNAYSCRRPRNRRNSLLLALTLTAAIPIAGLALPTSAWAQNCGRPAIFWNTGSGSFADQGNFTGSDGSPNCLPQSTDNVSFGGTGFPQAGGVVTFPASVTVNSLSVDSQGWTFSLGNPVTATSGVIFGLVTLTLTGDNVLSTSATGSINGSTLIIPDKSGVTAGIFSVNSLTMSGGGNVTVLGGATGSGANLFQVALSNNSSIDLFGNGPHASFVNIGGGTIDDSQVAVSGSTPNNVLWLAGENTNSSLIVSDNSVLTTQQLNVSAATGSTGTSVGAGATTVYGLFVLTDGATLLSGPLTLLTGAGGYLAITSGAHATSSSATVTGGQQLVPGFGVTGQNSVWTVNGPMSVSNTMGVVGAGGQLQVLGGNLTLAATTTPALTSTLTVTGAGSLLDVSGNVTVADSGSSALSLQAGGTGRIGGNLVVANKASSLGTVTLDGAGTDLNVAGNTTLGQAGVATMNLTNGATFEAPSVTIGATAPQNSGDPDEVTGLHTQNVNTVTVNSGAQLSTGDLILGQAGYAALTIGDGSVITSGSGSLGSQSGGEGHVLMDSTTASWQANTITVGDAGKGLFEIDAGNATTSGDFIIGNQQGSKGTVSITAGTLAVGGNLTIGSQGTGMFDEEPTGTLTVAGDTTVGDQTGGSGKMTLDGMFSLGGSLIVGNATGSTGSVLMQLGATDSGGGVSLATPQVILGTQADANGSLSLDGAGTAFTASSLTVGSFGMGKLGLTNAALLVSNGPVRVGDQVTSLIDAVTVASLSKINVNSTLDIGSAGIGTLTLTTGGKVTSVGDLTLGDASSASGLVSVSGVQTGVASTINYQSALIVGNNGTGELTVSGGGLVAPTANGAGTLEVGADAGSTGTISVSGVDATSGLAARLSAANLSVGGTSTAGGGTGKITVGTGGTLNVSNTLTVWKHGTVDVTGSGKVTVGTGAAAGAGTLRVDSGGTLAGPGTIVGDLVNAGGRVSPGDPVTLTVDGDYLQTSGILDLQIAGAGPGQADMLSATGDVQITGGVVDLEFIDGYEPTTGAQFDLFSGTDVDLSNGVLEFNGGAADFGFSTSFDAADDTYVLTDTGPAGSGGSGPVPEPPPWMLLLLGLGLLGLRRLRYSAASHGPVRLPFGHPRRSGLQADEGRPAGGGTTLRPAGHSRTAGVPACARNAGHSPAAARSSP